LRIIIVDTNDQLMTKINTLLERTRHMAKQEDVDAVVAQLDTLSQALVNIQGDLDVLVANQGAGQEIDLTALQAKVNALVSQAIAIDEENAPPPVEPPVEPPVI
jgi:short-subunit dehydrogenase involved in D-alanine esterification of teichoic acids